MKIQNINSVNFGKHHVTNTIEAGHKDFVSLDNNDKLAVIYDMLCEQKDSLKSLSDRQYDRHNALKSDLKTLSLNQKKMHDFNKHAFDVIVAGCSVSSNISKVGLANLDFQYNRNKLNVVG